MLRKTIIVSLLLVLTGLSLLWWVFIEQKKQQNIEKNRQRKLETQVGQLKDMVEDETDIHAFKYILNNGGQKEKSMHNETQELLLTFSNILTLSGASILCICIFLGSSRLIAKGIGRLASSKAQSKKITAQNNRVEQKTQGNKKINSGVNSGVLVNSGWSNVAGSRPEKNVPENSRTNYHKVNSGSVKERKQGMFTAQAGTDAPSGDPPSGKVDTSSLLYYDEDASGDGDTGTMTESFGQPNTEEQRKKDTELPDETIRSQTRDLENQMAKLKNMASGKSGPENSRPVQESLRELTQQVSAIREYASHQQERVQKLQDGYDWSIIKNFCLRIIRCIDNVEDRINNQSSQHNNTTELEDVRDELVFALESTGVEQFMPEINSEYRGQEKNTEAVKDKQKCDDPKLSGKIAKIIRPGYTYCVDEDNNKIVRTAQVKLYA